MARPVLFGKYLLLDRISIGGMAEVFRAKSFGAEGFEKLLAIKRILPAMAEDGDFIEMFIDEAKIAGQLTHANICQIYELGCLGKSHFISMEYIWGKDALQLINRFRRLKGRIPLDIAAFIAARVCEGLDYAHRKRDSQGRALGIVHRDISPQNILVSYQGEVKIIDFGIAKAVSKSSKTRAGVLKGKFGYMSPEQVRGDPIDQRSDVFSLGTLLFELCTGERLFQGESDFVTLEKVRNADVPRPTSVNPEITPALENIILKSLSLQADDRYQWASEFRDALTGYLLSRDAHTGARELSKIVHEIFARERKKELDALERYKAIGGQDLQQFAAPEGQRELAVSLLGLGPRPTKDERVPKADPDGLFDEAPTRLSARLGSSEDVLQELTTDDLLEVSGRSEGALASDLGTAVSDPLAVQSTHIFSDEGAAPTEPATQIFAGEVDTLAGAPAGAISPTSVDDPPVAVYGEPTVIFSELEGTDDRPPQGALPPIEDLRTELFSETEPTLLGDDKPPSMPVAVTAIFTDDELGRTPAPNISPTGPSVIGPDTDDAGSARASQFWPRLLVATIAAVVAAVAAALILFTGGGNSDVDSKLKTDSAVEIAAPSQNDMSAVSPAGDGGAAAAAKADATSQSDLESDLESGLESPVDGGVDRSSGGDAPSEVPDASLDRGLAVDVARAPRVKRRRRAAARRAATARSPRRTGTGYLIANTTPWAKVWIDGRDTGKVTPIPRSMKMTLSVGVHRVTFRAQGRSFTYTVRIRRGKTTKLIKRLNVD